MCRVSPRNYPFKRDLAGSCATSTSQRGIYLSSGYEYPGRYSRWDIVSVRPPLELIGFQREVTFRPLNDRGAAINRMLATVLRDHPHWDDFAEENGALHGTLKPMPKLFPEEERSKQPSVFSVLRALTREFRNENDDKLAFAGAFGYDLLFQFEPIPLRLPRQGGKDLQLFLCDDIIYMDRKREQIERFSYEFDQNEIDHAWTRAHGRARAEAARRASRRRSRPTTRRKSTWPMWRWCARACAGAIITKWFSPRRSARPTRAKPPICSSRCSVPTPAPTNF